MVFDSGYYEESLTAFGTIASLGQTDGMARPPERSAGQPGESTGTLPRDAEAREACLTPCRILTEGQTGIMRLYRLPVRHRSAPDPPTYLDC